MKKTTESSSHYQDLDKMTTRELLENINQEDHLVPAAVNKALPQIENLVNHIADKMLAGGRLFYVGAGTSGRLGVVDASECPPTFGVDHNLVIGIMAGGDGAIRKAVEFAEDDVELGWKDLQEYAISPLDSLIGIAASGTTPYVIGAIEKARENNILTGCITCNQGSPLAKASEFPVEVVVGPEFLSGSTRMKAGTAQKLVLNMISTSLMIKLGRVKGNKMVDMQLNNNKLVERGTKMVAEALNIDHTLAQELLLKHKSVRAAINAKKA